MTKKFVKLWHSNISLERLANIYRTTPANIVRQGERLNLNGKLPRQLRRCEECWFLIYCQTIEAQRAARLPCEGGEPVPYIEPGYTAYRSCVGVVRIGQPE